MLRYSMDLQSDRVSTLNDCVGYTFKNRIRCANDPHVVIPSLYDASKNIIDLHDDNELSVIPHVPTHFSIKRDFANGSHVVIYGLLDTSSDMIDLHARKLVSRRFANTLFSNIFDALRYIKVRANCLHVVNVAELVRCHGCNSVIDVQFFRLVSFA